MYMSSIYPQFPRAEQLYALRQNLMFNGQYALGKRIRRIPFQNGHAPLHDDAAVIDLFIHKMRRRAGDLRAVLLASNTEIDHGDIADGKITVRFGKKRGYAFIRYEK